MICLSYGIAEAGLRQLARSLACPGGRALRPGAAKLVPIAAGLASHAGTDILSLCPDASIVALSTLS